MAQGLRCGRNWGEGAGVEKSLNLWDSWAYMTTTWNPILIFFSGFAFFETIFSWSGFYVALGKNTSLVE